MKTNEKNKRGKWEKTKETTAKQMRFKKKGIKRKKNLPGMYYHKCVYCAMRGNYLHVQTFGSSPLGIEN